MQIYSPGIWFNHTLFLWPCFRFSNFVGFLPGEKSIELWMEMQHFFTINIYNYFTINCRFRNNNIKIITIRSRLADNILLNSYKSKNGRYFSLFISNLKFQKVGKTSPTSSNSWCSSSFLFHQTTIPFTPFSIFQPPFPPSLFLLFFLFPLSFSCFSRYSTPILFSHFLKSS